MEPCVPMMLLPKGIVTNTTNIYTEVASYPIVPGDKLWKYWHVYTTTNKRLQDPTARRLENFWWHVWKSWSSAKAPPRPAPHPILKKSGGPCSSGPRPTARFVSPHESVEEIDEGGEPCPSRGAAAALHSMPRSPPKKKPPPMVKKFVVASAATRRRPSLPRKMSLQSPTATTSAAARVASQPRTVSSIPERTSTQSSHESGGAHVPRPSAKVLGKRSAVPPRPTTLDAKPKAPRKVPSSPSMSSEGQATLRQQMVASPPSPAPEMTHGVPLQGPAAPRPQRASVAACTPSCVFESSCSGSRGAVSIPSATYMFVIEAPPAMQRAQSHNGYGRHSDVRNLSQGLFTGATASKTHVAAQGTIDQAGSLPVSTITGFSALGESPRLLAPVAGTLQIARVPPDADAARSVG